ncbi:MAG: hypothetical protein F9K40_20760 [Kofleriaceae bacterium]|nr:MAG: hypothetical protein F9K40_20760 [Kofleriaceae bacterium]
MAAAAPDPALVSRSAKGSAAGLVALAALAACLALSFWVYQADATAWTGRLASFKGWILAATVVYFAAGVVWMSEERKRRSPHQM